MPLTRRSSPKETLTAPSGSASFGSNNQTRKSTELCKLCSKLFPSNSNFVQNFLTIEQRNNHAKLHSDQLCRLENIFRNNNTFEIIIFQNCFGLSVNRNENNIQHSVTINHAGKLVEGPIGDKDQLKRTISLSMNFFDGQASAEALKQIRATTYGNGTKCCKLCPKKSLNTVTIINKTSDDFKFDLIVLHATKHLSDINFYSCNICEYSTNLLTTENGMYEHYSKQHLNIDPTSVKSNYFSVNYLKNQSAILETIEKCFQIELIDCETKFAELEKVHESATELRLILLRNQMIDRKKSTECKKCAKPIHIRTQQGEWTKRGILRHAQSHLTNIPILRCVFCDVIKMTITSMMNHLKVKHSSLILKEFRYYYVNDSAKFDKETDEMLYECFQYLPNDVNQILPDRINRYCINLRKKIGLNERIRCGICTNSLSVKSKKNCFRLSYLLHHALLHFQSNSPIYRCTLCNYSMANLYAQKDHFNKYHPHIKGYDRHRYYENNMNMFEPEIVGAMKKCFDHPNSIVPEKLRIITDKSVNRLRLNSILQTVKRKKEIGSFCDELIKNDTNEFNRIKCKVCSKELLVLTNQLLNRYYIIEHALRHTKLARYTCKTCDFVSAIRTCMVRHIAKDHHQQKQKVDNLFRDNSEKLKKEIIAVLKKCYQK